MGYAVWARVHSCGAALAPKESTFNAILGLLGACVPMSAVPSRLAHCVFVLLLQTGLSCRQGWLSHERRHLRTRKFNLAVFRPSLVLGLVGRGHPQGLALLLLDAVLAVGGSAAGLSVGHAEDVVGLNTAVHSAVAGNGLAEHQALLVVVAAEESLGGGLLVLLLGSGGVLGGEGGEGVLDVGVLTVPEGVDGGWGDRLLQKERYQSTQLNRNLPC